ncbi:hypothetical protein F5888DRAFT_1637925 [Russula emetica]|nr:hypothetical protein F5888DRAFT_1637925 [Russula emetica]
MAVAEVPEPRAEPGDYIRATIESSSLLAPTFPTSTTTDPSTTNHNAIFEAASNEYKTLTGQGLETHPFAAALEDYVSPKLVLNVFRRQAQAFDAFHKGEDFLMAWLTPIVYILFSVSETLRKGISLPFSPATTLFTAIGVLLGSSQVVTDIASYEALVNQFERIHLFLRRLDHCTFTPEMTELLAKIMAQILSILALSSKAIKEKRIKKLMKKVVGKTDVEDALQRLDLLTKEENLTTAMARNLEEAHHFDDEATIFEETFQDVCDNARSAQAGFCDVRSDLRMMNQRDLKRAFNDELKAIGPGIQSREKLRRWLSPPNPSINHNAACSNQHDGTARWFMRGNTFDEWKKNGSLLWIRGNPGSGKSVLCSAIIKDIKQMRSALVAYYYFDFMDAAKRNIRGLLTSLLLQLVDESDRCWDLLSQLHKASRDGSEQPSEATLAQCLKSMLDLPGQLPTYIIIDALDECPNRTGTPSAREKVLNFVEDLVKSSHPNLFICITSRPEQDITTILNPLASPSRRVSLHEEVGQREDINNYIRSFIQSDRAMRGWRTEDKELVIDVLSEQANGKFRWVYCQLDNLRRCIPSSIREILNELPANLDDTYERILHGIPKQLRRHAHRLFQCMVVASRPLRVEELAEIITIDFGLAGAISFVMNGWRPANPEVAVLSACSTLISIITDGKGSNLVQFSHVSVKEFLTSNRIQSMNVGKISQFHIALEPAHTLLACLCMTVLLQLNGNVDKTRLARSPLTFYAAQHWVNHANFGNVASQIQDAMELLFNPKNPHFRAWIWLRRSANKQSMANMDERPPPPKLTPLFYAAFFGFGDLARRLIVTHKENQRDGGRVGGELNSTVVVVQ